MQWIVIYSSILLSFINIHYGYLNIQQISDIILKKV